MDAADESIGLHEGLVGLRAVGRVRPDGAGGVGLVEQALPGPRALIGGGICRLPFADQPEPPVDRLSNPDQLRRSSVATPAPHGVKHAETLIAAG